MSSWAETFLGVIALATLASALLQAAVPVGDAVATGRELSSRVS
ncbi:MAG: hypothetical protein AB7F99_12935 [Vicinamibacterales bacterium]